MSKMPNIHLLVFSSVLISIGGAVHGQICEVADDGSGCVQVACSAIPEDQCLPTALKVDWTTGAISVAECKCRDMNACHVEFGNASPFAVGHCPPDTVCVVEGIDNTNDGLPDLFHAVCRPEGVSVCCMDIDDGPVPFDTCLDLGEEDCAAEGGMHHIARDGCSGKQACCLGSLTQPLCAELHPACCLLSGGVPLGPETTCTTANGVSVCGQICGGIAGLPCDDERAFCRLPDGGCCCDFMGVCTIRPEVCPLVLNPVCGCDEKTYSNECEAFAAGASIAHRGPCGQSACCLPGGNCLDLTVDVCVAEGGEPKLNARCETVTCSPAATGGCCVSDAVGLAFCQIRTREECGGVNGTYLGDGSDCPADPDTVCGVFACCLPDGLCVHLPIESCLVEGGEPLPHAACASITCGPQDTGACCLPNAAGLPSCVHRTEEDCAGLGGAYQGNGSTCPSDLTSPCGNFACCFPNGGCAVLTIEHCLQEGGQPSPDAECTAIGCTPQARGACCLTNANGLAGCVHETEERCADLGGAYQGDGSSCPAGTNLPCGEVPCCLPNHECVEANVEACLSEGGRPVPHAGGCALIDCVEEPVGACCVNDAAANLNCIVRTRVECASVNGAYQGDGSTCPSDPSLSCGGAACCLPNGVCVVLPHERCLDEDGNPMPGVPTCETVFCTPPPVGACCLSTAVGTPSCVVITQEHCAAEGGAYQGDDSTCSSDPNLSCGGAACCLPNGECVILRHEHCLAEGGNPVPGTTSCELVDCVPPPVGACCLSTAAGNVPCVVITRERCAAEGGAYQGDESSCPTDPNATCGDRCDGLCTNAEACFVGCGKLVQGLEGCVLFQTESGNLFELHNLGEFAVGDHVFVRGCRSAGCTTICAQGAGCLANNTIRSCLEPCGGIAGIQCEDPATFCQFPDGTCGEGDIMGHCTPRPGGCPDVWDPVCGCNRQTYSNECDAAAAGVSIAHRGECVRTCGGLGPAPPCEPDEFCRFPVGSCGDPLTLGVCVPIPDACPEIYDPVCGCDGTTYSNACEAIRAQVSIIHPGECTTECTAIRTFSDPPFRYCPPDEKKVRIVLNAPANATAIAVDDQPPAGWAVSEIGQDGVFDPVNGKVKWGPIFPPFPPELTYVVTPVETNTADSCFVGNVSIDGFNRSICGAGCLELSCCPTLNADRPHPACDQCPAGGCESCDDACSNGRVTMCELIGYACAWRHGCNDDLAGMTRAAFLWRNGECYCWNDTDHTWVPSDCDPSAAGCCGDGARDADGVSATEDPAAGVTVRVRRTTGGRLSRVVEAVIQAVIIPPQGTLASGLEIDVPQGWKTVDVSNGGEWDATNGKVKWGPLFGDDKTVVTLTLRRTVERERISRKDRNGGRIGEVGITAAPSLENITGTVAFDGVTRPVLFD